MSDYKMPERQPSDGAVTVSRVDGRLMLSAEGDGSLLVSEFNAWRLFGMLSLFLGLPLSKAVSKAIKLGTPGKPNPEIIVGRDMTNASFGDRVAAHLADGILKEKLAEQGIDLVPVERRSSPMPCEEDFDANAAIIEEACVATATAAVRSERLAGLRRDASGTPAPIPIFLTCPKCNARHIDEGDFATKLHHTHSCQACGLTWRPAVVPTVGVAFLPGFKNEVSSDSSRGRRDAHTERSAVGTGADADARRPHGGAREGVRARGADLRSAVPADPGADSPRRADHRGDACSNDSGNAAQVRGVKMNSPALPNGGDPHAR